MTEARRRSLRKRLADSGPALWAEALANVARSRWCRGMVPGKPGETPFKADLDFVLQTKSFQRLIEGFYNRGEDAPPPAANASEARAPETDDERWRRHLQVFSQNLHWPNELGPKPGRPGCRAPDALLAEFGFAAGTSPLNQTGAAA